MNRFPIEDGYHPAYEDLLFGYYEMVEAQLGTGEITSVVELQAFVGEICCPLSSIDGYAFLVQYAPDHWKKMVSVALLRECDLDLICLIKKIYTRFMSREVMHLLRLNSQGYRFLREGGRRLTIQPLPEDLPVHLQEAWRVQAGGYRDCRCLQTVRVKQGELRTYQTPFSNETVCILDHEDASLVWIGPVPMD
jgi:hypothetical protein